MLTKIQLRASGKTAHEVEGMLRASIDLIESSLGLTGAVTDQYIEGTPGKSFNGRLVYTITTQSKIKATGWSATQRSTGMVVPTNG